MVPEPKLVMKIVILAGGAGTRLWPLSTNEKPKQFQKLCSELTMFQETLERVNFADPHDIYVATNAEYVDLVHAQAPLIPKENIIAEPSRQDTGPCIGLAAALIAQKDPEAVMAVVYADHRVQDNEEFVHKLKVATELAKTEKTLNIIEVKAKFPNVNLGYVKIGKMLETRKEVEVYEFKAFHEKPDLETAKKFLSSYSYLWNTGYYVWRVDRILKEFEEHLPKTYAQLKAIQEDGDIKKHYPKCDKISIDYGIMEKVDPKHVRIIPADLGWSDIGTWKSLHIELTQEKTDNLTRGKLVSEDCTGCVIYNDGPQQVATLGLEDLVVINTGDNILICPKERSADLKKIVTKIHEGTNSH